jgi:hypothetical protein
LIVFNSYKWPTCIDSFLLIFSDPAKSHKLTLHFFNAPYLSAFEDSIKI